MLAPMIAIVDPTNAKNTVGSMSALFLIECLHICYLNKYECQYTVCYSRTEVEIGVVLRLEK